jgi:flagellar assembly factor FliW
MTSGTVTEMETQDGAQGGAAESAAPGTDASGADASGFMTIESAVLGQLVVPETSTVTLPAGLLGFERFTRFALIGTEHEGMFWLQSLEEAGLAFVLADPFRSVPDYDADLTPADAALIGATRPEEVLLLVIVTLSSDSAQPVTANLRAPVVVNVMTRQGRQVVLTNDRWGTTEPLAL